MLISQVHCKLRLVYKFENAHPGMPIHQQKLWFPQSGEQRQFQALSQRIFSNFGTFRLW